MCGLTRIQRAAWCIGLHVWLVMWNSWVRGSIKGPRCFIGQESFPLLLCTGWFQESIQAWVRRFIHWLYLMSVLFETHVHTLAVSYECFVWDACSYIGCILWVFCLRRVFIHWLYRMSDLFETRVHTLAVLYECFVWDACSHIGCILWVFCLRRMFIHWLYLMSVLFETRVHTLAVSYECFVWDACSYIGCILWVFLLDTHVHTLANTTTCYVKKTRSFSILQTYDKNTTTLINLSYI